MPMFFIKWNARGCGDETKAEDTRDFAKGKSRKIESSQVFNDVLRDVVSNSMEDDDDDVNAKVRSFCEVPNMWQRIMEGLV